MARRYLSLASIVLALASCRTGGARTTEHAPAAAGGERAAPAALAASAAPTMTAHFVDVGQGLSVLLEFPCGALLIDAGAADDEHVDELLDYLGEFFDRRTDLNRTIATVFITHPHIDHTRAIPAIAQAFTITNYVDDGLVSSSGKTQVKWIRDHQTAGGHTIHLEGIDDNLITALPAGTNGLVNPAIDPLQCSSCDPEIRVLSGNLKVNPGWPKADFENANNHSLVIRVDFGESSFLFTGDLEEPAIETMVDYYEGTDVLDVDVYQVGHHGSYNGTTTSLIDATTPDMAVISCGHWDDGKDPPQQFSTYAYGHPRASLIEMLEDGIDEQRASPVRVKVATAAKRFTTRTVSDAIYATAWDGTLRMVARLDGEVGILH